MNLSTLIGIVTGILIIGLSITLSTSHAESFLNLPGLFVVLGGTFAATMFSYPLDEILKVFKTLWIVFRNEKRYTEDDQREIVLTAKLLMQGKIHQVESELNQINNPFLRTGLQLLIDKTPSQDIYEMLQWRIMRLQANESAEAQIYRTMAMYAPAFGMLGTLIGLVNMLLGMGQSDMAQIGGSMALALLTTLYGVALANLFFKPIAIKFERRTEYRVQQMTMIMEGILLLARGRGPSYLREYLKTFYADFADELNSAVTPAESPLEKSS